MEEENRRLRERLNSPDASNAPSSPSNAFSRGNGVLVPLHPSLPITTHEAVPRTPTETVPEVGYSGLEQRSDQQATVSGIFTSANGRASYHGLTSTLYDDLPIEENRCGMTLDRRFGDERLMAFASTQRKYPDCFVTRHVHSLPLTVSH